MATIGEQLKQARMAKNISLEEISNRLRINVAYLQALEQNKFDFLPKPYVVAFAKSFANFVGLNGEDVIKTLREPAAASALPVPVPSAPEAQWLEPPPLEKPRPAAREQRPAGLFERVPYVREIAISVGIIITIALLLYFVSRSADESSATQTPEAAADAPASTLAASEVTWEQMVEKAREFAKPDSILEPQGLTLEARILAQVWVRLIADGSDTLQATFPAGSIQTWRAKENIKLRAGNISALSLTLNGRRLENLGPSGRPANLIITREGAVPEQPRSPARPRRAPADTVRRQ